MKYPKYKYWQLKRAKLKQGDKEAMKQDRKAGMTLKEIAEKYRVSEPNAWYHCMSDTERKELQRARYLKYGKWSKGVMDRKRKLKIQPEILLYEADRKIVAYKKIKPFNLILLRG